MTDKMPDRIYTDTIDLGKHMPWSAYTFSIEREEPEDIEHIHADLHAKQMEFLAGWIHGLTGKSVEEILARAATPDTGGEG